MNTTRRGFFRLLAAAPAVAAIAPAVSVEPWACVEPGCACHRPPMIGNPADYFSRGWYGWPLTLGSWGGSFAIAIQHQPHPGP